MAIDSGATSHYYYYVDDTLIISGIREKRMFDHKELESPSLIATAGMHKLNGTATDNKEMVTVTSHLLQWWAEEEFNIPITINCKWHRKA